MAKQSWKPGNMVYPVPAALVSTGDKEGKQNLFTVAWTGTICTNPPMAYISVRPERFSHHMIEESGEFVINLTNEALARATDYCGVVSGREHDKWTECGLHPEKIEGLQYAPAVQESPVSIGCKVREVKHLGSHDMFLADVVSVTADDRYMDENGRFDLRAADPIAYCHGEYTTLGQKLGGFGWSVQKKKKSINKKKSSGRK